MTVICYFAFIIKFHMYLMLLYFTYLVVINFWEFQSPLNMNLSVYVYSLVVATSNILDATHAVI